jgi:hypothetical protein
VSGCSVIKDRNTINYKAQDNLSTSDFLKSVKDQNLTRTGFYIQKAQVKINGQDKKEILLGSLKFEYPDKYLISIKTRTGIEIARIFISDDTILINDRINRKHYYGSGKYLGNKYGITNEGLPLIIGDYIDDNISEYRQEKCMNGKLNISGIVNGNRIKYSFDCGKRKSISAVSGNSLNEGGIEIRYNEFFEEEGVITPGKIEIKDSQGRTTIEIRIEKIEAPWIGSIEFIPGSKYETIQLK